MISVTVIADSINAQGNRITTFKLRYPRFIHAEFMTHRVFSRNASSSRAVPFAKLLAEVKSPTERAAPVFWGAEQKGMQTGGELSDLKSEVYGPDATPISPRSLARIAWANAAEAAAAYAERLAATGVHKSIVNRLLEPFSHINVVCTATEYDNFFGLRLDTAAEPTMRALAKEMWVAQCNHTPQPLKPGEWHLPFVTKMDAMTIADYVYFAREGLQPGERDTEDTIKNKNDDIMRRVSVARCARVSYESFETGKRSTVEEDLKLYDRLLGAQPLHASPAEHQATPDSRTPKDGHYSDAWDKPEEHGNFTGWRQYRKMLAGESCAPLPEGYGK